MRLNGVRGAAICRVAAVGVSLALLGALSAGCSSAPGSGAAPSPERSRKVVLIGWDGATWDVIDPMLRHGGLPNLRRLIESGSRAVLMAERPIYSPVVWTSLATGFPPTEHGITDFELPDPRGEARVLASTFHRRRAALWQMVSSRGKSVGFIGWWTTWPAEPVRGYVVSDHMAYNRWSDWAQRPDGESYHLTFPPGLADRLAPLAVRPEEIDPATLTALVPFDADEQREMMETSRPVMFHAPSVFRFGYATDAGNLRFAKQMLDTVEQPDLLAVVFILSDVAGHVFWHHYEPQRFRKAGADLGRLHDAIPNVYEQLDRWTGEILTRLDPDTRVVVLSDHGMGAKGMLPRPGINPAGDHTPEGILVVAGPDLPRGADLGVLSSLDLAPTVLAMLDLPVARDMPGRVIAPLFSADRLAGIETLESYGDGRTPFDTEAVSPAEDEYLERLRSLGYVQ